MSRVSKPTPSVDQIVASAEAKGRRYEELHPKSIKTFSETIRDPVARRKLVEEAAASATKEQQAMIAESLEPWEQCPDVWKTKATFFQWMRGQMRRAWSRHPVKVAYMHNHRKRVPLGRVTVKNPEGLVWGCECEHCHQEFKQTECEVDHIDAAGSFKGWHDFEAWMTKLMHINFNSIRVVCKECHRIISYAERMGYSFEEAKLEKKVIAFTKLPVSEQVDLLPHLMSADISNAKKRRAAYKYNLQEEL